MARVIFLHGLESGPGGNKSNWLRDHFGAFTPALREVSLEEVRANPVAAFDVAVRIARAAIAEHRPEILVGSSFGGAVAVRLMAEGTWRGPAVLVAPASRKLGGPERLPSDARVVVLHGERDDVVPLEDSRRLVEGGAARLLVVPGGDHPLNVVLEDGTLTRALGEFGISPLSNGERGSK